MSDRLSLILNIETLFKKRNNKIIPFYTEEQMQRVVEFGNENNLKMKLVQMKDTRLAIRCKCGGCVKIFPCGFCMGYEQDCDMRKTICYDYGFSNTIFNGDRLRDRLGVREPLDGILVKL